jgi:beta-N-acetylhexosaminidase
VVEGAVVATGDAEAAAAFGGAARAAGVEVLSPRSAPDRLASARPRPERGQDESAGAYRQRLARWRAAERRRRDALADWRSAEARRLSGATTVAFAGYGDGPVSAEVAVATDTPYVLAGSDARVRIATYGTTPGAMSALVDVLTGEERAPGRLPVDVADVERPGC